MAKTSRFLILLSFMMGNIVYGQQRLSPQEIETYKREVGQLISFLEFSLNTIGSAQSSKRQKNIIITQSYKKVFRDSEVQIEDDLAPYRSTVTNKDVESYLQDIDFFFSEATFDLELQEIEHSINDFDQHYFLAKLSRTLKGKTVEGNTIENTQPRFIEVNLDAVERELKIASIYSTKVNELAGVNTWWNNLPIDWKFLFADKIKVDKNLTMRDVLRVNTGLKLGDTLFLPKRDTVNVISSVKLPDILESEIHPPVDSTYLLSHIDTFVLENPQTFTDIKGILDLREIDLSSSGLTDLSPISKMTRLRKLNISQNPISNLGPIKSLTLLKSLDFSQTQISDVSPVQFAPSIQEIFANGTQVSDLSPIQYLNDLQIVDLSETPVRDLTPIINSRSIRKLSLDGSQVSSLDALSRMDQLAFLNVSNTRISQLSAIASLPMLNSLEINGTSVPSLEGISGLSALEKLSCENTKISSLDPLLELPKLTNVYCDKTPITERQALDFMRKKSGTVVTYKSDDLIDWWKSLSTPWKQAIGAKELILSQPSKATLQSLANRTELDLRGNTAIEDLAPLKAFSNLEVLLLDNTPTSSLEAIGALKEIRVLSFENTKVNSLDPLIGLAKLEEINGKNSLVRSISALSDKNQLKKVLLDASGVADISPLYNLGELRLLSCENTAITKEQVLAFLEKNPECVVLFHAEELDAWWQELPENWKTIFGSQISFAGDNPTSEELHQIEMLPQLKVEGMSSLRDLAPVVALQRLRTLQLVRTQIAVLTPLAELPSLQHLTCTEGPLRSLAPLRGLQNLAYLEVGNTPVESLEPIKGIQSLKHLGCSGTQIRDIKEVSGLVNLESLDISNTRIKSLKYLSNLKALTSLTCYNSKVPGKKVQDFKKSHPEVDVVYY
ncbi:MAG: leucine-rich repeat domain-containing protein [Bacteroidota bacterium]